MLTVHPEAGVRLVPHPPFHFSSQIFPPKCAMLPGMKLQGESGVSQHSPDPPIKVDPSRRHPTLLSIVRITGEVSRQRVACFFPFASHYWTQSGGPCGVLSGHEEGKEQAYAAALLS